MRNATIDSRFSLTLNFSSLVSWMREARWWVSDSSSLRGAEKGQTCEE